MSDDRIDFSALDPTDDPERFEQIVSAVTEGAVTLLESRRAEATVFSQVVQWWKPLLAAAAITGVISIGTLAEVEVSTPETESEIGLAEAIGVPVQIADWIWSDEAPTPAELFVTLEDG